PQSSDEPVAGEEDAGETSRDGEEIIVEFHSESTQNLCVSVEGPGEDTCADSVDCVVCGDGICQSDVEDEVTCSEDCSAIEEDSEDPLPEESNPALGEQGDLSDEDYQTYLDNSFSTCTNNFGLCVRIPKVTGLESNICGPSVTCEELKQKFEERALRENIQLAPNLENSLVLRFLRAFFGR
ncbi:MAG: hypothetical protein KC506_01935, partial [Nanoarchaeota archaeon]|nr:hypothetical protein [Nanoarchaeota archaeon]